ncbi:sensor histidine kinase [uncultured Jannaschia sp.]|uniref:ATP-binding protein n=1 Tax=uncultured Jannaschia sp. TaxID=293347 RepID=UPI002631D421|nr:sensor histidine kinase [uncultured Jannaschia sp.]
MDNVVEILECASLLLLCGVTLIVVRDIETMSPLARKLLLGLVFSVIGILVMHNPVEPLEGVRIDPRAAVIVLAATFGGPVPAIITTVALLITRYSAGGVGATVGLIYIAATGSVAIVAWLGWHKLLRLPLDRIYVMVQALVAGGVPVAVILIFTTTPPEIYWRSIALTWPVNLLAVWFVGDFVLKNADRRAIIRARREAEAKTRMMAASASVILFEITRSPGADARFSFVTGATRQILGQHDASLLNQTTLLDGAIADADRAALVERLEEARVRGHAVSMELPCEVDDGPRIWLRVSADYREKRGPDHVWEGMIADVTEERRTAEMKNNFISVVSHELRTPLTAIQGALGMVEAGAGGELPPKAARMVEMARQNGARLARLVNDILDIEQLQEGRMRFLLRRESGRTMVETVMSSLQNYAPQRGLTFALRDESEGAHILVDRQRFEQILSNLMSNALKFSPDGGRVTLGIDLDGTDVLISVTDQGAGIPKEFAPRIFERFEQAEAPDTRRMNGTGLGLNIARALTLGMGGEIDFESSSHGTTFVLRFPLADAVQKDGSDASTTLPKAGFAEKDPIHPAATPALAAMARPVG